ncbi:MAG: hypothetical protein J6F30_04000 [Cellulosilyticum sp.]|nr:hypothetical protein [Cellulosilyticum sp.]
MRKDLIETNLEARVIDREGDQDFFIETFWYPTNFELDIPYMSRIQFPMPKAILVRTTPANRWVTIHVLSDTDLFSSFVNFELDLTDKKLVILKEDGYIRIFTKDIT